MTTLRTALDVQFQRIAQMQAELDALPVARERRRYIRTLMTPASHNGNGHRADVTCIAQIQQQSVSPAKGKDPEPAKPRTSKRSIN